MTNFIGTQLTKKGLALIAKSGLTVTFTKAETGSGIYDEKEDISTMTELKKKKQSFSINSALKKTETQANVKFVVSNKELTEGYLFTEIGLYALDQEEGEILYAVCYSTPKNATELQAYNGVFEASVIMSLLVDISNDGNVLIDPQGVYALEEDLCVTNEKLNHIADCLGDHTIKSNVPENAKFTDTNTWRGIQNNLTSTSATDSLSANQGKILNESKLMHKTINTLKTDFNTLTETGIYHIVITDALNTPASNHGTLYVDATVGTKYQVFMSDIATNYMHKRRYDDTNKKWSGWTQLKLTDTITGVQNNLVSTLTDEALSAAQGKVLNDKITDISMDKANVSAGSGGAVVPTSGNWLAIYTGGGSSGSTSGMVIGNGSSIFYKTNTALTAKVSNSILQLSLSGMTISVKVFY